MDPKFFVGIDISKLTLDAAVIFHDSVVAQLKIENTEAEIKKMLQKLRVEYGCTKSNTCICAEHMGKYASFLLSACVKKKFTICFDSALRIKRSIGIQRGKNDALDAVRIAQYAGKNFRSLKPWQPPRVPVEQLKTLLTIRKRLVKIKVILLNSKSLESHYSKARDLKKFNSYSLSTVKAIKEDIRRIDKEIDYVISNDSKLSHQFEIITSVPSVGKIIAVETIIHTNEFENFQTAKMFASYCGIAPFAHTSGTSLTGKPRVSNLANKRMKSLLHIAAINEISSKKSFLFNYYERKVKEGKSKMAVINAIRNKIVHRIFACVRNDLCFVEQK